MFVHPLVDSAVLERIAPARRSFEHWRAAQNLREEGAPDEEIAAQLLKSPPTEERWPVGTLRSAAQTAVKRGSAEAAVPYLRRALREPQSDEDRKMTLRDLGRAETAAVMPEATTRFEELLLSEPELERRGKIYLELGKAASVLGLRAESAHYLREGSLELEGSEDLTELRMQLDAEHVNVGLQGPEMITVIGQRLAENSAALEARGGGSGDAASSLYAHGALFAAIGGHQPWTEAFALARKALDGGDLIETAIAGDSNALWAVTGVLTACGELPMNIGLLTEAIVKAQRQGSVGAFPSASYCRGVAHYHAGNLPQAAADLSTAIDARRLGWAQFLHAAYGFYAHTLVDMGRLAEAEEVIGEVRVEDVEPARMHPARRTRPDEA